MEEISKKKSNKALVAAIIALIILLLGSIGYICYDKEVFDGLLGKDKPIEKSKQDKKAIEYKVVYTDEGQYLIVNKDGQWKEYDSDKIEGGTSGISVFGIKDGKLYYSDSKNIKYIDFDNNNIQVLYTSDWKPCKNTIFAGPIVGEKLYFRLSTSCHDSKLVSLDINDSSKKIVDVLDFANYYSIIGDEIYYTVGFHCADSEFNKYNIKTKKNTKIGIGICNYELNGNKILYFKNNNSYNEKKEKFVYSDDSGYYNYDVTTSESKKIDSIKLKFNDDNAMEMLGKIYQGNVYYSEGNKVIKNADENNQTLYAYTNNLASEDSKIRINIDNVILEDVLIISWEEYREIPLSEREDPDIDEDIIDSGTSIIKDGKLYSEKDARSMLETYKVTMKDGSTRNFSILDTLDY